MIPKHNPSIVLVRQGGFETDLSVFSRQITQEVRLPVGRDSSVGIATRYWLDGPGIFADPSGRAV